MKECKVIKSRINKKAYEIIKNIKLICFINPIYIDSYSKFLENKLKESKGKLFFKYLNDN